VSRSKPILIGCPHCHALVRGQYDCDERGEYRLGGDGTFLLERLRCGQREGRCAQTLCVLHRLNRGGGASWYPESVWPVEQPRRRRGGRISSVAGRQGPPDGATMSLEA